MFLVNSAMVDLQIGTAGLVALLGYAVVFVGLIALMVVILIEGKIAVSKNEKAEAPKAAAPAAAAPAPKPVLAAAAPGSAGEVKLFNVPDKDAAMLMAIVAHKLNKPLNELQLQIHQGGQVKDEYKITLKAKPTRLRSKPVRPCWSTSTRPTHPRPPQLLPLHLLPLRLLLLRPHPLPRPRPPLLQPVRSSRPRCPATF